MTLNKLLYKILPKEVFSKIRYNFYTYQKKIHKPLNEQEFRDILEKKLGFEKGRVIFIHSSLDFLNIDFSAYILLNTLLDLVGPEGTLIFPSWHFNYRAEEYLKKDLVFDIKRSPTVMGLLPELARRHPTAIRSIHPTTSIVAIGKYAKEITDEHEKSIYPCGEMSPYYKMMQYDALIVGLGVKSHFLSFVHCPEDILKNQFPIKTRTDEVFQGKVKLIDGSIKTVDTLAAHSNIQKRDIPAFIKKNIPGSIFSGFQISGNSFYKANSRLLFNKIIELAQEGKTIYNSR